MSVYGTRLLGKCDAVPGYFHLGTKFFHINFVPLIPLQTYVVLSENGKTFRGVKVSLSGKTILFAWGRVISFLASVTFLLYAITELTQPNSTTGSITIAVLCALASIGTYIFLMWHPLCTRASASRAFHLAGKVGMSEAGMAALARLYDTVPAQGFAVVQTAQKAAPVAKARVASTAQPVVANTYSCRVCRKNFTPDRCYGEPDGGVICHACWATASA